MDEDPVLTSEGACMQTTVTTSEFHAAGLQSGGGVGEPIHQGTI